MPSAKLAFFHNLFKKKRIKSSRIEFFLKNSQCYNVAPGGGFVAIFLDFWCFFLQIMHTFAKIL